MSTTPSALATQSLPLASRLRADRGRPPSVVRQYQKRRAEGRCVYFGCPANAAVGRRYCRAHLDEMNDRKKKRSAKRKKSGLCVSCGKLPQFWGVCCVVCRRALKQNSLPFGVKRAIRLFREAENKFEVESRETRARLAVRKLLASKEVCGIRAKALELYAGLDSGKWRDGAQVSKLMGISRERVRQLLQPSKLILTETLKGDVPWKAARTRSQAKGAR
jgi:hypothetical protein